MTSKQIYLTPDRKKLAVEFPYSLVEVMFVKNNLPDREWHPGSKTWRTPASRFHAAKAIELLTPRGYAVAGPVMELSGQATPKVSLTLSPKKHTHLFPFQREGVEFLLQSGGRALLGDDMGTGKTIQAIAYLQELGSDNFLVVAPSSVVYKWHDELTKWAGIDVPVVDSLSDEIPSSAAITSWGILTHRAEAFDHAPYHHLILDEAHYAKNPKAQRTKAATQIAQGIPNLTHLTGSPLVNRPIELYPLLYMVDPHEWPSWFHYGLRYCAGHKNRWGWDMTGRSHQDELAQRLARIMLRRTKGQVLDQLPPVTREKYRVDLPKHEAREYKAARANLVDYLRAHGLPSTGAQYAETLVLINTLRHIVGRGKAQGVLPDVVDFLESTDDKAVVYAIHHDVVETLLAGLYEYHPLSITGVVSAKERRTRQEAFQDDASRRVMVISQAGEEGIDLYAANHIWFAERNWTPKADEQAEGRLHRIGQRAAVTAHYPIAHGTLDEWIDELVESKRDVIRGLVGADQVKTVLMDYLKKEMEML